MSWVGRALSSVSQYYKEINPSTLSGAIDIVVVQRKDPQGGIELACSPFHVRFGKLTVLRPVDRNVTVRVNDRETPFVMKVGETGEAFFVFATDEDVPADMQTSPLAKPVPDNQAGDSPEELDLGAAAQDASKGGKDISDASEGGSSRFQAAAAHVAEIGSAAASAAASPSHLIHALSPNSENSSEQTGGQLDLEVQRPEPSDSEVAQLEQHMRGASPAGQHPPETSAGEEVRADNRRQQLSLLTSGLHTTDGTVPFPPSPSFAPEHPGTPTGELSDHLMLDMSGYKVKSEDQSKAKAIQASLLSRELGEGKLRDDLVSLTQALLRSADVRKAQIGSSLAQSFDSPTTELDQTAEGLGAPFLGWSPAEHSTNIDNLALNDRKVTRPLSGPTQTLLESTPSSSTIDTARSTSPAPSVTSLKPHSSQTFCITADDTDFVFELAVVSSLDGDDVNETDFDVHQITYEAFRTSPDIVNDSNLVMRYRKKYLTWDNAAPVLASLAIYQKSISGPDPMSEQSPLSEKPVKGSAGRPWSRWFSKSTLDATSSNSSSDQSKSPSWTPVPSPGQPESTSERPKSPFQEPLDNASMAPTTTTAQSGTGHAIHYVKTLRLTSEQLKSLDLQPGANTITFSVSSSYSSNIVKCSARIFLWDGDFKIVVSDIDGTITKSDALGHVFAMVGRDWTHQGVAKLYTDISKNGYKLLYLTSRAIGQADTTREYLKGVSQGSYILPDGPVVMSPDRLMTSLHREVIARKPEVFKMAALQDIQRLFTAGADAEVKPFYAGFGNRITDALSYRSVDIPSSRIFTIDAQGDVVLELLELAGYKSSYIAITDLVDQMFPPINRQATPEYTDFQYWRTPLPPIDLPDLSPPSPALSARSDSSRYSRVLGNIASTITRRSSKADIKDDGRRSRASSPSPRATSPLAAAVAMADDEPDEFELGPRRRADSLPNSLSHEALLEEPEFLPDSPSKPEKRLTEEPEEVDEDDELDFSSVPY